MTKTVPLPLAERLRWFDKDGMWPTLREAASAIETSTRTLKQARAVLIGREIHPSATIIRDIDAAIAKAEGR